jgi:hypothetical protein
MCDGGVQQGYRGVRPHGTYASSSAYAVVPGTSARPLRSLHLTESEVWKWSCSVE